MPIMVVLGNPPYSGHSANKGEWIRSLVADYVRDQKPEQAKWLQDDYVKFIRFGQWRIEQTGAGILAFITNHSYLESPTFAGMRDYLMETFDEIYVLDLHGNTKKRERTPDGKVDKNVFDIQQGVAISLFVKSGENSAPAKVYRADLWGERREKYEWLSAHEVSTTDWEKVAPSTPLFLFSRQDPDLVAEYETGWRIPDIFSENGNPAPGIVTTHDQFAISWNRSEAEAKVGRFLATESESEARSLWRLCSQDQWDYARAKATLALGEWKDRVGEVLYRPFDVRWTIYDRNVAVHLRHRVTDHLLDRDNIALLTSRLTKGENFAHAFITEGPSEVICLSPKTSNNAFVFPLYLYPSEDDELSLDLDGPTDGPSRRANLSSEFIAALGARLNLALVEDGRGDLIETVGPEDVLAYIYTILHSNDYRFRYSDLLRHDFPRVPLPPNQELFRQLAEIGHRLISVHRLEAHALGKSEVNFPVPGSNVVDTGHPRYVAEGEADPVTGEPIDRGRLYISEDAPKKGKVGQYLRGIDPEVWGFHVGGYQVCEKWLKDRRGQALTNADLAHFERIVAAVEETIRVMDEIDAAIPGRSSDGVTGRSPPVDPAEGAAVTALVVQGAPLPSP